MAVLSGPEPAPVAEPAAEAAPLSSGQALVLAVALVRAAAWLWPEPAQAQAEALPAGPVPALVAVPPLPVLAPALPEVAQLPVPELEPASALPPVQVEARLSPSRLASWQASAVPAPRLGPVPRWRPERTSSPEAHCRLPVTVAARPGIPSALRSHSLVGRRMASTTNTLRWPEASETSMRTLLGAQLAELILLSSTPPLSPRSSCTMHAQVAEF